MYVDIEQQREINEYCTEAKINFIHYNNSNAQGNHDVDEGKMGESKAASIISFLIDTVYCQLVAL